MTFNPVEFLNLAKTLTNDQNYNYESAFRTSISRAYYSAFLWCRTWLEGLGFSFPRNQDAHALVIKNMRAKGKYMPADALKNLRHYGRNEADYNLKKSFTVTDVSYWIQLAEYVLNSIP